MRSVLYGVVVSAFALGQPDARPFRLCMTGPMQLGEHKLYEPMPVECWFVLFCEEENGARWSLGTEKNVVASTFTTPRDATVYCLRSYDLDGDSDIDLQDWSLHLSGASGCRAQCNEE